MGHALEAFLRSLSALSLEVGVGAAAAVLYAGCITGAGPAASDQAFVVCFAVIGIYNVDHFLDARTGLRAAAGSRRNLYADNQSLLLGVALVSCLIALVSALILLTARVLIAGAFIAALLAAYLIYAHFSRRPRFKEIWVALGYSVGVWVPALIAGRPYGVPFLISVALPSAFFLVCALTNVYVHAIGDFTDDIASSQTSLATTMTREAPLVPLLVLAFAALLCLALIVWRHQWVGLLPGIITSFQWIMFYKGAGSRCGYWIGEGAFLLYSAIVFLWGV